MTPTRSTGSRPAAAGAQLTEVVDGRRGRVQASGQLASPGSGRPPGLQTPVERWSTHAPTDARLLL